MRGIPVLAFAAYSGTGKTTLIEQVVASLKKRGLRIAVVKHDVHGIDIDREGKDSWRFSQAGADISIVSSPNRTAYIEQRPLELEQVLARVRDVDLILVEGYKKAPLTQIGICRKASGKGFTAPLSRYIAVVCDLEKLQTDIPTFGFEDIEILTDFILKNMPSFTRTDHMDAKSTP